MCHDTVAAPTFFDRLMSSSKTLLIVDDDITFCDVLKNALMKRGFEVTIAHSVSEARSLLKESVPGYAVVDLNMPNESGLSLIPDLKQANDQMNLVVLTGYASIATAVEAIKLGATNYLTKPSDADEIVNALTSKQSNNSLKELPVQPMTTERLEWEHIQKILTQCNGNISQAARQLGMHRRTLQRKLQKRPSNLN